MARVSVGGDEDEHEEELTSTAKRIRTVGPCTVTNTVRSSSSSDSDSYSDLDSDSGPISISSSDSDLDSSSSSSDSEKPEQVIEEEEEEEERSHDPQGNNGDSISITLEEPDVLDCPICVDPLAPPVYQCENGHIACSSCCTTMRNKCGTCCLPIGYNRCRAMEKVLESVKVPCQNTQFGCKRKISYSEKLDHEKTCNYAPCSCPHPFCDYTNSSKCLYTHFAKRHPVSSQKFHFGTSISIVLKDDQRHVFLQERRDDILFILNRATEPSGNLVNVVCVAPSLSETRFFYELTARSGSTSLNLRSYAQSIPKWPESESAKTSLLVPNDFVGGCGQLKLEVIIRMDPDSSHSNRERDN